MFAEHFYRDPYTLLKSLNITLDRETFTPYHARPTVKWDSDVDCSLMPFHCTLYHGTTPDELGRLGQRSINRTIAAGVLAF